MDNVDWDDSLEDQEEDVSLLQPSDFYFFLWTSKDEECLCMISPVTYTDENNCAGDFQFGESLDDMWEEIGIENLGELAESCFELGNTEEEAREILLNAGAREKKNWTE